MYGTTEGVSGVHLPRKALWAVCGREPAPKWAGHHSSLGPMRLGLAETLRGAPPWLGGQAPSPLAAAPPPL